VRGTELSLVASSIPYFVRAIALETFTGGENNESDQELIRRMLLGVSAKVLSSRVNMRASLLEKFPNIRDSSVIGAGDPEMTRDKHTVFPGSVGGYVDWYVGTTRQLKTTSIVTEEFTDVTTTHDLGKLKYYVSLDSSQFDGLYYITGIQNEETAEFCEIIDQRPQGQLLFDEVTDSPKIENAIESAFSAYQIFGCVFTSPSPVNKIRVYGIHAPGITEIQQWVNHCSQAPVGLDVLVKGAIPTTVRFSSTIYLPAGETFEDRDIVLRNAIAEHVNRIPFGGLLAISNLVTTLHNQLPSGSYISEPSLFATTYLPDGRSVVSQTAERLVIDFPPYATNRTTLFFCDPAEVSFTYRFLENGSACG
jgi:hypothetical protein